ncbi:hypothetical protein KEM54_004395 [Ascosphaera aggregata]|nr:hypothetical protein KEM54_004395 [Ascosphaera aggregata]
MEQPPADPQDVVASSPRFRRKSSTLVDAIHDQPSRIERAPAQLYSTESGRLFHSGRIVIIMVGLPARGKTHISVAIARYLRWLGVNTRIFHLGDYRRATLGHRQDVPADYFFVNGAYGQSRKANSVVGHLTQKIELEYLTAGRQSLAKEFAKFNIETLFIESLCDNEALIKENVRNVKISSPDYVGMDPNVAIKDYLNRISARIPHYETMTESDLNFIKMINAGERMIINNCSFGYLHHRIVFYLLNLHNKSRRTYFARSGPSPTEAEYRADDSLSEAGVDYANKMAARLLEYREEQRKLLEEEGITDAERPLVVWTSTRRRTIETAKPLLEKGCRVRHRSQISRMNPGAVEGISLEEIKKQYPEELKKHEEDPYNHRYPRAESYHDLAVKLEPIILELERESNDLLIIAHESVLRVLYGYLMACNAADIPFLSFPRNEITEIIPGSYHNTAKKIHIPNLPPDIIAASPEGMKTPGLVSGTSTPMPVLDEAAERVLGKDQSSNAQWFSDPPRRAEQISQAHAEDVV